MKRLILALFLTGCPKKDVKSLDEIEREERLNDLLEAEDEEFESLPEADDD